MRGVEMHEEIPDSTIDGIWHILQTRWLGTAVFGCLIFGVHGYPLVHTIVGWYGAWWCYSSLTSGYKGWGRLIVGFLCWSAVGYALMNELEHYAAIFFLRVGIDG